MIDLHTHTLWSDGELTPAEHVRRAQVAGYEAIAITDHADSSNIEILAKESAQFARDMNKLQNDIVVLSGMELTHILPEEMKDMVEYARGQGISVVVVHGETIMEPVRTGTDLAAIQAKVDILAHPGFITAEEIKLAVKNDVCIEITARKGHSLTNGHVAKTASLYKARLVIDTDSHSHNDFISGEMAKKILLGAGIQESEIPSIFENSRRIVNRALKR
jgi:histidinol phosphatase-like PHP family hydrolase